MSSSYFQPMKAVQVEDFSSLTYPVLVQPKIDGIRCVKYNGVVMSGQKKPIANIFIRDLLTKHCPDNVDGELVIPGVAFEETVSAVMSSRHQNEKDIVFKIFDKIDQKLTAKERYRDLYVEIPTRDNYYGVACIEARDSRHIQEIKDFYLTAGYEGIMIRHINGFYKFGESTLKEQCLLKWKPFIDDEATVVSAYQEKDKNKRPKNSLGGFVVRHHIFGDFRVGSGYSRPQREQLWQQWLTNPASLIGRLLTFKYQKNHIKDKPCPAIFKAFRS